MKKTDNSKPQLLIIKNARSSTTQLFVVQVRNRGTIKAIDNDNSNVGLNYTDVIKEPQKFTPVL